MYCAMVMPDIILAGTRTEDDESNNKTIARLLNPRIKLDIDSLFLEAKSIQERMCKIKAKRSSDEFKQLEKHMSTGKIFKAI